MIKIVLADDHEIIRNSIPQFLSLSNIKTIALSTSGDEAIAHYQKHQPDVMVLDLEMPKKEGLLVAREILHYDPLACIVMYSGHLHNIYISVLKNLGVLGFVQKGGTKELSQAIQCADRNEVYYCVASTSNVLAYTQGISGFELLSLNEKIVALLLAYSMSLDNIANALKVELVTARTHKYNIFKKLGIRSMSGLYTLAARHGMYRMHNQ